MGWLYVRSSSKVSSSSSTGAFGSTGGLQFVIVLAATIPYSVQWVSGQQGGRCRRRLPDWRSPQSIGGGHWASLGLTGPLGHWISGNLSAVETSVETSVENSGNSGTLGASGSSNARKLQ